MVPKFIPSDSLSVPQIFFAQRMIEALAGRTIDTYRVRLHNPNTILQELYQVLTDYRDNKIKSFEITINPLIEEAIHMLKTGNSLLPPAIEPKLLLKLLQESQNNQNKKNEDKDRKGNSLLMHALKIQISDNSKKYGKILLNEIEKEIDTLSAKISFAPLDFEKLNMVTDFWLSELLYKGYSKSYLYKLAWKLFKKNTQETFASAFDFLKEVTVRSEENYRVVFQLLMYEKNYDDIRGKKQFLEPYLLSEDESTEMKMLSASSEEFFKDNQSYFIKIDCTGFDYLSVVTKAQIKLNSLLDSIHLGFPEYNIIPIENALVAGENSPHKTQVQNGRYNIDGYFRNHQRIFDIWNNRLNTINQSSTISRETKNKITSAVRYLRLGWEAGGLEQKFLHYWIGIEYLFSNYDVTESTIRRLRKFFVVCESTGYVKRNIANFHGDIKRMRVKGLIPNYDEEMNYLQDINTYIYIKDTLIESHPLLSYRAALYHERISNHKALLDGVIKRHEKNLDWHLARIYRIRNEIVHEASLHMNIETIVGNLRYYLNFMLNILIDYLHENPIDIDEDGKFTIDDCLSYYEILYKRIETNNYDFSKLMSVPNDIENFH